MMPDTGKGKKEKGKRKTKQDDLQNFKAVKNFIWIFWHTKKSYFLVGNREMAYKTCCTAQNQ
jgi:hypothetical protein